MTLEERFWPKLNVGKPDECWEWKAGKSRGYGQIRYKDTHLYAHRVAWTFANGEIPDGMWVLHHCDNPLCCNPSHLFLGTPTDNQADMIKKGRSATAKLTALDVRWIRHWLRRGYTQESIADAFDVNQSQICRLNQKNFKLCTMNG